ncbi:MAG: competence type IV pilus minor pilin ComGD [Mycoplasmatales bacterium]
MNNQGYTLMEMLMVLVIVTTIFYLSSMNFLKTKEQIELTNDVQVLAQAYQSLQAKALTLNQATSLEFTESNFICKIDVEEVCHYDYHNHYELNSNFSNNTILINDDGNVLMGGTITYKYQGFTKSLVITIGSGRYEIK